MKLHVALFGALLPVCAGLGSAQVKTGLGWPTYGGDPGGQRYSSADQITPANVMQLRPAWVYHTRALETPSVNRSEAAFEATPVLQGNTLYLSTPFDQVIAVDAGSGSERWRYDPKVPASFYAGVLASRGVALWQGPQPTGVLRREGLCGDAGWAIGGGRCRHG